MIVPFCEYETHECETVHDDGRRTIDAIAAWKGCACLKSHTYQLFAGKLSRFNDELHLGFDRVEGNYVVYRWVPETMLLHDEDDNGERLFQIKRILLIVLECKYAVDLQTPLGGRRRIFKPRMFGEWMFGEKFLGRYRRRPFDWQSEAMVTDTKEMKQRAEKERNRKIDDLIADTVTLADKGNPRFIRTAVRVPENVPKRRRRKAVAA